MAKLLPLRAIVVIFELAMCSVNYMPVVGFPVFKQYLLEHGVYQDACRVSLAEAIVPSDSNVLCLNRMLRFDNLVRTGSLFFALMTLASLHMCRQLGLAYCNVTAGVLAIGGLYAMSKPLGNSIWNNSDNLVLGVALLSLASPLVMSGALYTAYTTCSSPGVPVVIILMLSQLANPMWSYLINFQDTDPASFFRQLFLFPCIAIVGTLLVAPFVGKLQKSSNCGVSPFSVSSHSSNELPTHNSQDVSGPERKPLDLLQRTPQLLWSRPGGRTRSLCSMLNSSWYWTFCFYFLSASLIQSLFFSGGIAYAEMDSQQDIRTIVLLWSPISAAVLVPVGYLMVSRGWPLPYSLWIAAVLTAALTFLSFSGYWAMAASLLGVSRVFLVTFAVSYCRTIFGPSQFPQLVAITLTLAGVSDLLIPSLDGMFLVSRVNVTRGCIAFLAAQAVGIFILHIRLRRQVYYIERRLLGDLAEEAPLLPMPSFQ